MLTLPMEKDVFALTGMIPPARWEKITPLAWLSVSIPMSTHDI